MAASDHIQHLKKSDLVELKSLNAPPAAVKMVLEAVCILKGIQPKGKDYWQPSKTMMADPKFLDSLKTFDKEKVPAETMELIRKKYLTDPNFDPDVLRRVSRACEGLCKWVKAVAE